MSTVARLWRHPVKSMLGEELDSLTFGDGGVLGDRTHAFFAVDSGERISAKKYGALLSCRARCLVEPTPDDPIPPIEVTFDDGGVVQDDPAELTRRVSDLLGFEVRLATEMPGTLVDLAPVHVIAASTLRWLAGQHAEGQWDPRRFRPNILIDDDGEDGAAADDAWLGCDLRIGTDVVLEAVMPTPRCVVTTRAQGELPRDQKILRTVTRVHKRDVPVIGESGCVGVYGDVVATGVVSRGDTMRFERITPRQGAVAAALEERANRR